MARELSSQVRLRALDPRHAIDRLLLQLFSASAFYIPQQRLLLPSIMKLKTLTLSISLFLIDETLNHMTVLHIAVESSALSFFLFLVKTIKVRGHYQYYYY